MIEIKIINEENYFVDNSIKNNCYRIVAEEDNIRSFGFLIKYFDLEFWRGKIFCGRDYFYEFTKDSSFLAFSNTYGNYFSEKYKVGIFEPSENLYEKIVIFNKAKKLNPLLSKHQKPLKPEPVFSLEELINNCKLVFLEEQYTGHNGFSIIFFQSGFFDSKKYIIDYLKSKDLNVFDMTN